MRTTLEIEQGVPRVRLEISEGPRAGVWLIRLGWIVTRLDAQGGPSPAALASDRHELAAILGSRAAALVRRLLDAERPGLAAGPTPRSRA